MATVPPVPLLAQPDSALGAMLLQYAELETRLDQLSEQREALNTQIKNAARQQLPSTESIELIVAGTDVRYSIKHKESWRLNGKAVAEQDPLVYVQCGKKVSSWELRRVKP